MFPVSVFAIIHFAVSRNVTPLDPYESFTQIWILCVTGMPCHYNLKIWKITDCKLNSCDSCNEFDTIYWYFARRLLHFGNTYELGTYEIIFGNPNEFDECIVNQLNSFITLARYFIYRCNKARQLREVYDFEIKNWLAMKK